MIMSKDSLQYDVGLSFAGEQREYVEHVASELQSKGVRVFYDDYEAATLWGKDLYSHLDEIYRNLCCILFVSKEFFQKVWPNHERQSAQAIALEENGNTYFLQDSTTLQSRACPTLCIMLTSERLHHQTL